MEYCKYYTGLTSYFGENDPGKLFEDKLLPLLRSLGIKKEKDIKNIFDIVKEIAEESYSNGVDNTINGELNDELNDY